MKKLLAILFLLLMSASAHAVVRQYCKCDTGAQSGCTATTPDTPSEFVVNNNTAAGDEYQFCQGGQWNTSSIIFHFYEASTICVPTCTNRVLIKSYVAGWGGSGVKPILNNSAGPAIQFGSFFETGLDGGFTISDLSFTGRSGVVLSGNVQDITIGPNNTFTTMSHNFIDLIQSNPGATVQQNTNVAIVGNAFSNSTGGNSVACIHGGADGLLIESNTFSKCGGCSGTCHTMYLAGWGGKWTIRNNYMEKAGAYAIGSENCQSGNISVRGKQHQMTIEGNVINNSAGVVLGCGGIQAKPAYCYECIPDLTGAAIWDYEYLFRTIIRGNTVIDHSSGASGISIAAAPYVIVENNTCIMTVAQPNFCFEYPDQRTTNPPYTYADEPDIGGIVRNNTCIMLAAGDGATCFGLDGQEGHGNNVQFVNNIAYYSGAFTGTQNCFRNGALASYTAWNNNICYGADRWSSAASTSGGYTTHSAAHAAGFDTWSTAGGLADDDPLLATPTSGNSWSAAITSDSSPAHNNGSNTYKAKFDRLGCLRDTTPSIGAEERGGTGCQTTIKAPVRAH